MSHVFILRCTFFSYSNFSELKWTLKVKVAQSYPTLCNPMEFSIEPHGIFQARILECVAFPFSRGSSQPKDQTQVSHNAGRFFTIWATREAKWTLNSVICNSQPVEVTQESINIWMDEPNVIITHKGFPDSSAGKESACNAGDFSLIPGLERYPGEGIGYPLQYSWASLVVQLVKSLPVMQETWVQSLPWKDPLEKGRATHSIILGWRTPWTIQSIESQRHTQWDISQP